MLLLFTRKIIKFEAYIMPFRGYNFHLKMKLFSFLFQSLKNTVQSPYNAIFSVYMKLDCILSVHVIKG